MSSCPSVQSQNARHANGSPGIELEGADQPWRDKEDQNDEREPLIVEDNPPACVAAASRSIQDESKSVSCFAKQGKHSPCAWAAYSVIGVSCFIIFMASIVYTVIYVHCLTSIALASCKDALIPSVETAVIVLSYFIMKYNSHFKISTRSCTCIAFAVLGTIAFVCIAMFSQSTALGLAVTVVVTAVSVLVLARIEQKPISAVSLKKNNILDIICAIMLFGLASAVVVGVTSCFTSLIGIPASMFFSLLLGFFIFIIHTLVACFIEIVQFCYFICRYRAKTGDAEILADIQDEDDINPYINFTMLLSFTVPVVATFCPNFIIPSYIINAAVSPVIVVGNLSCISPATLQLLISSEVGKAIDSKVVGSLEEQSSSSEQQTDDGCSVVRNRGENGMETSSSENCVVEVDETVQEDLMDPNVDKVVTIHGDGNKVVLVPAGYQGNLTVNFHNGNTNQI